MENEFTLEDSLQLEPRRLYVIKNEKGEYYCKAKPYWFKDINRTLGNIAQLKGTKEKARFLLQERKRCDEGGICCNKALFYGFNKIFIEEVKIAECKND